MTPRQRARAIAVEFTTHPPPLDPVRTYGDWLTDKIDAAICDAIADAMPPASAPEHKAPDIGATEATEVGPGVQATGAGAGVTPLVVQNITLVLAQEP